MKNMNKSQNRKVRQKILALLFATEFHSDQKESQNPSFLLSAGLSELTLSSESQKTKEHINQVLKGIKQNKADIDKLIEQTSHSWKMNRISIIDLNIMRLAIYEMFYAKSPLPFKVCIDEALEIAKKYSTKDSVSFINGNLDKIYKNKTQKS